MTKFYRAILFTVLILASENILAQPGGGHHPCPKPPCIPAPISGIEYLIGLGGLFGARKIMKSLKKTK